MRHVSMSAMLPSPTISPAADHTELIPRGRRAVTHDCVYQVYWCAKYKRPLLEDVKQELHEIIVATVSTLNVEIRHLEITDSSVSATLRVDPTTGIHSIVTTLKSVSSSTLRQRHQRLRSRAPSLWNQKYLVSSVGRGHSDRALQDFLEQQRRG